MISLSPSASTSKMIISAHFGPRSTLWNVQGVCERSSGASHQPSMMAMSFRPSPLMSPMPRPWLYLSLPGEPLTLTTCMSHGFVGSAGGVQ